MVIFIVVWANLTVFHREEGNGTNTCVRFFSFLVAESSWTSIKQSQTLITHNANWHCRVRFYTFLGQPLSKQLYNDKLCSALIKCLLLQGSIHYKLKSFVLTLHIKVSASVDWWTQTIVCWAPVFSSVILECKKFQNLSCAHNLAIFKPGHYWAWIPRSSAVEQSFMAFCDGVVSR